MKIDARQGLIVAAVLLMTTGSAAAADNLKVRRSEGPTSRIVGEQAPAALQTGDVISAGDALLTGSNAHLTVLIDGGGSFTLGDDTSVRVHSSEASNPPARAALVRMRVAQGVVRIDGRAGDQQAPADVRLNLGALKLRVFGADAWAQALPGGDEVCLINGAVEILAPDRAERLDQPGECLRYSAGEGIRKLAAKDVGSLAVRLARTAYDDDFPAHYNAEQALASGAARPMMGESAAPLDDDTAWRAALDAVSRAPDTTLRTAAESAPPANAKPQASDRPPEPAVTTAPVAEQKTAAPTAAPAAEPKPAAPVPAVELARAASPAAAAKPEPAAARPPTLPVAPPTAAVAAPAPAAPALEIEQASDTVAVTVAVAADASAEEARPMATAYALATPAMPTPELQPAPPEPEPELWRIVLGSFPDRDKAEAVAMLWRRDGLEAEVVTVQVGPRLTNRVLSGRYASREAAAEAAQPLRRQSGFREAWVVRTALN